MIRHIPPITSTGRPKAERSGKREKSRKLDNVIKVGIGRPVKSAPNRLQRVDSIYSWEFISKPKLTRYCPTEKHILIDRIEEPTVRVLDNITEVAVVAYLPQVKENDIHIEVHGDILEISGQANDEFGLKKYAKEMLLPFAPDPKTTKSSLENHILEIKLKEKREIAAKRRKKRK